MLRHLGFLIWLLLSFTASADQTQIPNYSLARDFHWQELYMNGGWSSYQMLARYQHLVTADLVDDVKRLEGMGLGCAIPDKGETT